MTPKQITFCKIFHETKDKKKAMEEAGYSMKFGLENADKILKSPKVIEYLKKLEDEEKNPTEKKQVLSEKARKIRLTEIALNLEYPPDTRLKALDILNKMDGTYTKSQDKFKKMEMDLKKAEFELKKELANKKEEW